MTSPNLSDAAVEALVDRVEEVDGAHQLGEKRLNQEAQAEVERKADAEAKTDETVGDNTPGLSMKDLNGAPKDTQVKSAPAKKQGRS